MFAHSLPNLWHGYPLNRLQHPDRPWWGLVSPALPVGRVVVHAFVGESHWIRSELLRGQCPMGSTRLGTRRTQRSMKNCPHCGKNLDSPLRAARKAVGLTQVRLAELAGVSQVTVHRAEAGVAIGEDLRARIWSAVRKEGEE